jgi:membrane associated rhomboid family serine protease
MGWQDRSYNRDEHGGIPPVVFSLPKLTPLTMAVIGTCLVMFLLQNITGGRGGGGAVDYYLKLLYADGLAFLQPWRFVTYQYLHAGVAHFFFNMIGVFFFLPTLELMWGWRKALAFYTLGGVAAGLTYGLLLLFAPPAFMLGGLVGASGSILAAMGAVALLSPNRQLILLVFPVPIRVAVALFGVFFLMATIIERDLSHAAHLGGLVFGFFSPYLAGPVWGRWQRDWQRKRIRQAEQTTAAEEATIDRILQKVHDSGMNSLTRAERNTLKRATERQRIADSKRARR